MQVDKFSQFADGTLTLRYFAFDWDDNILHMPTKILMDEKRDGEWVPDLEVSTEDFAIKRHDTENFRIRNNNPQDAFKEFRDTGSRGGDAFLQDTIEALNKSKKAPAWNDFLQCLSEGAIFSIITARGHERESIKKGVEYIIDNVLTKTSSPFPRYSLADVMMQQLKKFRYYFDENSEEEKFDGAISQHPMVQEYLKHCDFFGVSSDGFAQQFGAASASNPEEAKIKAIEYCIEKCLSWAEQLEEKLNVKVIVKFGMSDDDPKNMASVIDYFSKYFAEKRGLSKILNLYAFYTGKDTTVKDKNLTSGEKTSFKTEEMPEEEMDKPLEEKIVLTFTDWRLVETSHQPTGMESSTLSMRDNMTKRLYPTTPETQANPYHHQLLNQIDMIEDLRKELSFGFKKPKKNKKK